MRFFVFPCFFFNRIEVSSGFYCFNCLSASGFLVYLNGLLWDLHNSFQLLLLLLLLLFYMLLCLKTSSALMLSSSKTLLLLFLFLNLESLRSCNRYACRSCLQIKRSASVVCFIMFCSRTQTEFSTLWSLSCLTIVF